MKINKKIETVCVSLLWICIACETNELDLNDEQQAKGSLDGEEGCEVASKEIFEVDGVDKLRYRVTSKAAKDLIRGESIPRRASKYSLPRGQGSLPKVLFNPQNENAVKARLMSKGQAMLGNGIAAENVVDNVQVLSISTDEGAVSCAKGTGAFTGMRYVPKRGVSKVKDAKEAVNLALEQVAAARLVKLHKDESLDVVSVTSTRRAGWEEVDGELVPIYFDMGPDQEPVTQFKSDYTVSFGRRYRGVPMVGESLRVRLDPDGKMAAFIQPWRDIIGETPNPVDLLSEEEIEEEVYQDLPEGLEPMGVSCGYFEAPGIGYSQGSPGIGCEYRFNNPAEQGTLNGMIAKKANASADPSLPLDGEEMDYELPEEEESDPSDDSVDIPN